MAQCTYGGPRGIWLECRTCTRSDKVKSADINMSDAKAAKIFRAEGWTGNTNRMLGAKCPDCQNAAASEPRLPNIEPSPEPLP